MLVSLGETPVLLANHSLYHDYQVWSLVRSYLTENLCGDWVLGQVQFLEAYPSTTLPAYCFL